MKFLHFLKRNWKYMAIALIFMLIGSSCGVSRADHAAAIDKYREQIQNYKDTADKYEEKSKELEGQVEKLEAESKELEPLKKLSLAELQAKQSEAELKKKQADEEIAKKAEEEKQKQEAEKKASAEKAEKEKQEALAAKTKKLSNGTFVVGRDIDPGLYDVKAVSGQGNLVVYKGTGPSLKVNEMFGVGDNEFYQSEFKNVELSNGDTIKLMSGVTVQFTPKQ